MGRRPAVAWVHVTLVLDEDADQYVAEITSWQRGSSAVLQAFLDIGHGPTPGAEREAFCDYARSAADWLITSAKELDDSRIL